MQDATAVDLNNKREEKNDLHNNPKNENYYYCN